MKQSAVYILASQPNGTLYLGVTSNLSKRIYEHKNHLAQGFSDKYDVGILVWYELHESMEIAISREKAIKKWNRHWKLRIIEEFNPEWKDLYESILF
ncbi:MAG: GIY-YIG nuclease family protein [Sulfuricurvum sp.]|uniref:GIY-YIG nuclease family protein n=1 Tax=Sulfuricurvum sp. TaxID=2025608 RepID=UPI0026235E15|nr:GIY-YIG nuclease family protein [Sulfuricurvum sp.]MDD2828251.1 GIY-YIG nuclease family protein [Sulfuricurvum sp.]MDD4949794.1 GIY-YIG nuclease family protein [Sulfuricurvum sp.]